MAKPKKLEGEEARVEYVALSEVARWPRNPKQHDLPRIKSSIQRFGFVLPAVRDERTGRLVAGHGRLEGLLELKQEGVAPPARIKTDRSGEWYMPVIAGVAFANEQDAEDYLLADNRLVELGGWDTGALAAILESRDDREALDQLGWSDRDVARLLAEASPDKPVRGPTPADQLEGFNAGAIKQLVFYFKSEEFQSVLDRMTLVMQRTKAENHTQAFQELLTFYEKHHAPKKAAG